LIPTKDGNDGLKSLGIGWFILAGLTLVNGSAAASELSQGLPPLHVTRPDPEVFPRFYSVAQAPDGLIFVGGQRGVHLYDGRQWSTLASANQQLIRSLVHDGKDRLYVGGYGQFGFIEPDPTGQPRFIDLTPTPDEVIDSENFADVWDIEITPDGVFFRALYNLFRLDPTTGRIDQWHHPGRFGDMLWYDDAFWIQFRGSGLRRLDGLDFLPVEGGAALTEHVVAFLPLPEGGLLTMGRDGRWRRLHQGRLSDWPAPETLPTPESLDSSLQLPDGSFALGGPDGRLHLLDTVRREHRVFQVASDFISDLALAADGGILIQTDQSTTHLFWPSPWTRLGNETGLIGRVHAIVPWQDSWLAVTNSGVQRLRRNRFEPTGWSSFETWDWLKLDEDRALLADSFNLLEVDASDQARVVFEDIYPRMLRRSRYRDGQIHIGTERGLAIIARNGEDWQMRFQQERFTGLVTAIHELTDRELLLTMNDHGLVRLELSEGLDAIIDWTVLGASEGIDYGDLAEASMIETPEGSLLISTRGGFYHYENDEFHAVELPGLDRPDAGQSLIQFRRSPTDQLWAYRERALWQRGDDLRWRREDISALEPGVVASINFAPDGRVLVGDQAAILQYDAGIEAIESRPMSVQLRQVQLTSSDGEISRLPLDGRALVLPHDIVSVRFDYALPNYRQPQLNQYRARMLGYEESFSEWGRTQRITYSQFQPGLKRFEVEGRDHLGRISRTEPFQFEVLPPWYWTLWARLVWIALALGLLAFAVWMVIRWRVARLEAERKRLAGMVEQRTADLEAANRKLENMANIDGLTGVANRRRLDEYLQEAWIRARDRQSDLAVALIDVDHFKRFNDTRGHQAGDEALRNVASLLTQALRRNEDVVARYGGEEFMVVLPAADLERGQNVAETLRAAVESSPLGITASVGVAATRPEHGQSFEALIEAADQALYRAKQNGRNRVEAAEPLSQP